MATPIVLNRSDCLPDIWQPLEIFLFMFLAYHYCVYVSIWVEARNAAPHLTMLRTAPHSKELYLAPDTNSAESEKPWTSSINVTTVLALHSETGRQQGITLNQLE